MKKIITLLTIVGLMVFSSCEGPEGPPGMPGQDGLDGAVPVAFEIKKSFFKDAVDGYIISEDFSTYIEGDLFDNETVLVYRLEGINNSGSNVWQLIPTTVFFSNGDSITYDYNFSKEAFTIFVGGDNVAGKPVYINNQVFRFVIIPADFGIAVNKSNYLEVMKALNLDESKIQQIQF